MSRRKKTRVELRYYEVPRGESVLALLGDGWKRNYGNDVDFMHFHNLWEIGRCYYGSGNMEFADGRIVPYCGGIITSIPVNVVHNTRSTALGQIDFWEFLFIDVEHVLKRMYGEDSATTQLMLRRLSRKPLMLPTKDNPVLVALFELIKNEASTDKQQNGLLHKELSRQYVCSLLAELTRTADDTEVEELGNSRHIRQIKPALEYVEHHFAEQLRVQDLADSCGMSETHFRRLFEDSVNMTPVAYINHTRIRHACVLLTTTDKSVEAISGEVGFISQATFNRNFTRLVGQPALKWKRTADQSQVNRFSYNISAREGWF